jgi:hypothetical protein
MLSGRFFQKSSPVTDLLMMLNPPNPLLPKLPFMIRGRQKGRNGKKNLTKYILDQKIFTKSNSEGALNLSPFY